MFKNGVCLIRRGEAGFDKTQHNLDLFCDFLLQISNYNYYYLKLIMENQSIYGLLDA